MKLLSLFLVMTTCSLPGLAFETITFPSQDSLLITADVYMAHKKHAPFILLYHQAGYSRGEYREIAPVLNRMGFNVMSIDQRSGDAVNTVVNETARRAREKNLRDTYLDALPDLLAGIAYAKSNLALGKLLIWGSSYSASLALKISGDLPEQLDGVLAFSPGEYFERLGESSDFIKKSAININIPVFITSAAAEKERWWTIYEIIPAKNKTYFLPKTPGIHGSSALWSSTNEHEAYWTAVKKFLSQFLEESLPDAPQNVRPE